jgi:outer membrane lipoprotein SlyB
MSHWNVRLTSRAVCAVLMCVGLLSFITLSGCQSNPRSGTYPANPRAGSPPDHSGTATSSPAAHADQADIQACNDYAAQATSGRDTTTDTVKDAAIGGAGGAGLGAAGGAIAGSAGKGAAIGAGVGALAGTLYGINENRKDDQTYQNAYRTCMQQRGY